MHVLGVVLYVVLSVFLGLLWVRFIVDWVQVFARQWRPKGIVLVLLEAVYTVTDPPINTLRRLIPPLRLGAIALDLSFLIVMIATYIALQLVVRYLV